MDLVVKQGHQQCQPTSEAFSIYVYLQYSFQIRPSGVFLAACLACASYVQALFCLQLDVCLLLPVYIIHGLEHHVANVHKDANCRHELVLDVIVVYAGDQHQFDVIKT